MKAVPLTLALIVLLSQAVAAAGYVDLGIAQYHRLDPIERFMQYIPSLSVGWKTDRYDASLTFNLYEDVNGPVSVHSVTPWTAELRSQLGAHELVAGALVFVDVFDKAHPYRETLLETKLAARFPLRAVTLYIEPCVRASDVTGTHLGLGGGLEWGPLFLGINHQDTKDYYMLGRDRTIATARLAVPVSNGHKLTVELSKALGEHGRESTWLAYSFDLTHLVEW